MGTTISVVNHNSDNIWITLRDKFSAIGVRDDIRDEEFIDDDKVSSKATVEVWANPVAVTPPKVKVRLGSIPSVAPVRILTRENLTRQAAMKKCRALN
jgi:hypothetical protein